MDAVTDESLAGTRTSHDIDVVVRSTHVGFSLLWVIECKHWKTKVTKLHVLGLRTIVTDVGADRGLLLAERGFQAGAQEAAQLTNVQLTSLEELRGVAAHDIGAASVRALLDRVEQCRRTYWEFGKVDRIKYGLRPEPGAVGDSTTGSLKVMEAALHQAILGRLPPTFSEPALALAAMGTGLRLEATTPIELVQHFEPRVAEIEAILSMMAIDVRLKGRDG